MNSETPVVQPDVFYVDVTPHDPVERLQQVNRLCAAVKSRMWAGPCISAELEQDNFLGGDGELAGIRFKWHDATVYDLPIGNVLIVPSFTPAAHGDNAHRGQFFASYIVARLTGTACRDFGWFIAQVMTRAGLTYTTIDNSSGDDYVVNCNLWLNSSAVINRTEALAHQHPVAFIVQKLLQARLQRVNEILAPASKVPRIIASSRKIGL